MPYVSGAFNRSIRYRIYGLLYLVRAVLEDEDEAEPVAFIGSAQVSQGIGALVSAMERVLGVSSSDLRRLRSADEVFNLLRSRTEKAGVFVLLLGNLGSHHSTLDLETFRGLALADEVAPFIVINDQDAKTAWSFSLVHELAHLFLGQSGVSGQRSDLQVERFCNDVAGELLLPSAELAAFQPGEQQDVDELAAKVDQFAQTRRLGSSMVAYRLFRAGRINRRAWTALSNMFRERWANERSRRRRESRERDGGPNFYVVRSHRVGDALVDLVGRMLSAGALTTSKAGKVLGVSPKQVGRLIDARSASKTMRRT